MKRTRKRCCERAIAAEKLREAGDLIWEEAAWSLGEPSKRAAAWKMGSAMKRLAYCLAKEIDNSGSGRR